MRCAGSPPGIFMKIRYVMKLTATRTRNAPSSRRMTKASTRAPSSGAGHVLLGVALVLDPDLGARVERVTQPVTEDVEREHRQDDRDAGDDREPRCSRDPVLSVGDQRPPGRIRRLHPGPEKREARLREDVR